MNDSDEVLVQVEGVSKKFCRSLKRSLWYGVRDIASDVTGRANRSPQLRPSEFWAVNDVSFELRRGECLGLIGPNGAGKSTLLKMLNGLIKPDYGRIGMRGHVGALIELGTGFNPILTGRENIYVNASVHGIPKSVVDRKLDAIVEFSELEKFIDTPFQNYSSGMKVRLGFAIAAQLEPDVLIIDEVLAVGDAGFRWKCYEVIDRMISNAAVIFVSHSMEAVTRVSSRCMVVSGGRAIFDGDPLDASVRYLDLFEQKSQSMVKDAEHRFLGCDVLTSGSRPGVDFGGDLRIKLHVESPQAYDDLLLKVNLSTTGGQLAAEYSSRNNGHQVNLRPGRNTLEVHLKQLQLLPQRYNITFSLIRNRADHLYWCRNIEQVEVRGRLQGHQPYQLLAHDLTIANELPLRRAS